MKKTRIFLVLMGITFSVFANAAQVYGSITKENRSVGAGAEVSITCLGESYGGITDRYGSYSIYVPKLGKCAITVKYNNIKSDPFFIYSYNDPARYDFDLGRNNGKYFLRRR